MNRHPTPNRKYEYSRESSYTSSRERWYEFWYKCSCMLYDATCEKAGRGYAVRYGLRKSRGLAIRLAGEQLRDASCDTTSEKSDMRARRYELREYTHPLRDTGYCDTSRRTSCSFFQLYLSNTLPLAPRRLSGLASWIEGGATRQT